MKTSLPINKILGVLAVIYIVGFSIHYIEIRAYATSEIEIPTWLGFALAPIVFFSVIFVIISFAKTLVYTINSIVCWTINTNQEGPKEQEKKTTDTKNQIAERLAKRKDYQRFKRRSDNLHGAFIICIHYYFSRENSALFFFHAAMLLVTGGFWTIVLCVNVFNIWLSENPIYLCKWAS